MLEGGIGGRKSGTYTGEHGCTGDKGVTVHRLFDYLATLSTVS